MSVLTDDEAYELGQAHHLTSLKVRAIEAAVLAKLRQQKLTREPVGTFKKQYWIPGSPGVVILHMEKEATMRDGDYVYADAREAAVLAKLREQEPIYQIKAYDSQTAWHDATEGAYHVAWPSDRRIVYAAPLPAVVQDPVAWLVTGPYEKRAFTDLSFADASCRGLNKGFGEDAYVVTPLVPYAAPPTADWYCEAHPEHLMGHDGCTGGGIPECARVGQIANQLRLARQEIREIAQHRDDLVAQYRAALAAPLPAVVQVPVAWVWNPASQDWEKVRAPGHWQQGAIYAFGPEAPAQGDLSVEASAEGFESVADYVAYLKNAKDTYFAERNSARDAARRNREAQAIPAPWREAVKVAREALGASDALITALIRDEFADQGISGETLEKHVAKAREMAKPDSPHGKVIAAVARIDALEGGE